ncbi:MAG: MFS transporter [Acidimicrobiia bacterium]
MNEHLNSKVKSVILVLVLSLALAIIVLDTTLLNVSLGAIIKELDTNIQSLQWVITAYALTLTSLTILGGRLGDIFGRRKMFILGAIIFAIGSFITSISGNIPTMIIGESIIEGIGAALMMPATMSILITSFHGRSRAMAMGIWGGVAGASAALGPVLGGYLTTHYSWRWGFRINIVIALILVCSSIVIKESKDIRIKHRLDWVGIFLSTLGLLSFVYGIIEASSFGWFSETRVPYFGSTAVHMPFGLSFVPYAIAAGVILIGIFAWWEWRLENIDGRTPLVSIKLFENKTFSSGLIVMAIVALGQSGLIFALPVFFQSVRGFSALETGLSLMPMSLVILFVAPLGGYLSSKIRPRLLTQIGMVIQFIGLMILRSSFSVDATRADFVMPLLVIGFGMGLVFSQVTNLTLSTIKPQEAGEASGVNSTMRQLGATFGSAIIGSILLTVLASNVSSGIKSSTEIPQQYKAAIAASAKHQASGIEFGGVKSNGQLPPAISKEIVNVVHQSTVEANKISTLASAIVALFGLLVSFLLPNMKKITHSKPMHEQVEVS